MRYRRYLRVPVSATTAARGSYRPGETIRHRSRSPPPQRRQHSRHQKAPDRSGYPVHRTAHREIRRNYPPRPAPPRPTRAGIFTTRIPGTTGPAPGATCRPGTTGSRNPCKETVYAPALLPQGSAPHPPCTGIDAHVSSAPAKKTRKQKEDCPCHRHYRDYPYRCCRSGRHPAKMGSLGNLLHSSSGSSSATTTSADSNGPIHC